MIQCFLARTRAAVIDPLLLVMQQFWLRMLVMYVVRREQRPAGQTALAIDPETQHRAETPLLSFAGLMHFGIARKPAP
ncbi:hypothetical protein EVC45_37230 [Paraburkholderia sp. UYCP14C]|uniref:hypothetical protein n=1 Tax=Paraburkholderia sp. UYCP14C TaxID=2511130 RepID=UPI0010229858|nr:hypothetical protein [Paraburkholderia sp. UYCP14C]RZF24727.1 hypothetical protein EVC45_37230 [Paraburkholderia sp. UYCP14C]